MADQELMFDTLISGDRPSIYALGYAAMESIKRSRVAVFTVDVLGRVQLMDPKAVQIVKNPKVEDATLDKLSEDVAIQVMIAQGDNEQDIVAYLKRREDKNADPGV